MPPKLRQGQMQQVASFEQYIDNLVIRQVDDSLPSSKLPASASYDLWDSPLSSDLDIPIEDGIS